MHTKVNRQGRWQGNPGKRKTGPTKMSSPSTSQQSSFAAATQHLNTQNEAKRKRTKYIRIKTKSPPEQKAGKTKRAGRERRTARHAEPKTPCPPLTSARNEEMGEGTDLYWRCPERTGEKVEDKMELQVVTVRKLNLRGCRQRFR